MYSILAALVIAKRHFAKNNKFDVYKKIYRELQNVNLNDDGSVEQAIELIQMLLSNDLNLAKMIIHLINQSRTATSNKTYVISGDLSCHKAPDLSNLSQKILRAVHKILPKAQSENTHNANVTPSTSHAGTMQQFQSCSVPSSSLVFTINKNAAISISGYGTSLTSQTSHNIFKLMPLGKPVQSVTKNLTVVPMYDNLIQFQSCTGNKYVGTSKNSESPATSSTHLYTINDMKLACLSGKDNAHFPIMVSTTRTTTDRGYNHVFQSKPSAGTHINTIQTLLTAAQMVDNMSASKAKMNTLKQSEFPSNVSCGLKNIIGNAPVSLDPGIMLSSHVNQSCSSNAKSKPAGCLEKAPLDAYEPLDFSIPKSVKKGISGICDVEPYICKGEIDEEEDALIIVDDDERSEKVDDRDCKVELEEIVLKSEPCGHDDTSNFLTKLIDQPCSMPVTDIDHTRQFTSRRKRKRSHLFMKY